MGDPIIIHVQPGTPVEIATDPVFCRLGKRTTFCLLVLPNGYEVSGSASCVRDEDFDPLVGQRIALQDALKKAQVIAAYLARSAYVADGEGDESGDDFKVPSKPTEFARMWNSIAKTLGDRAGKVPYLNKNRVHLHKVTGAANKQVAGFRRSHRSRA